MFERLQKFLNENASGDVYINLPQARFAPIADAVITGSDVSEQLAQSFMKHVDVKTAEFIPAARCVNIRFRDTAIEGYLEGVQSPLPLFTMPCEATQWEEEILTIRYAHYRASNLAEQGNVPLGDAHLAHKLAVAAGYCVYRFSRYGTEEACLHGLAAFAAEYHAWHESLLRGHVAMAHSANGDLMQKEAIQGPLSGALLARSAAAVLRDGLLALGIEQGENNADA